MPVGPVNIMVFEKKMRKSAYLNSPNKLLGGSRSLRSSLPNYRNSWHNSNTVPAYFSEFSRPVRYRLKCYPLIYFFKGLVLDELELIFNWAVLFWIICWIWVVNSDVIWWDKNFGRLVYKSCTAICGDVGLIDRSMDLMTDCSFKYLGFYMAYTGRVVQLLSSSYGSLTQFWQFVGICHLPNDGKRKVAAHKLKLGKWKIYWWKILTDR